MFCVGSCNKFGAVSHGFFIMKNLLFKSRLFEIFLLLYTCTYLRETNLNQDIDTYARVMSLSVTKYLGFNIFYDVEKFPMVFLGKSLL